MVIYSELSRSIMYTKNVDKKYSKTPNIQGIKNEDCNFPSISMAIQKGNAQCVTGCVKDRSSGFEGLFNFHVQEADEL